MRYYRWYLAGLLFICIMLSFFDRSLLGYAVGPVQKQFGFNDDQFGILLAAFGVGYLISAAVNGLFLVDKYGIRWVLGIATILWSIFAGLMAISTGFWSFLIFRFFLGLTEGALMSSIARFSKNWFPRAVTAMAVAILLLAPPLTNAIAPPILGASLAKIGWEATFIIFGGIGIIWSIVWLIVAVDSPREDMLTNDAPYHHVKQLVSSPPVLANFWAALGLGYIMFFGLTWLPGYVEQTFNVSLSRGALFLSLPWLGGLITVILAALISDTVIQKTGKLFQARSLVTIVCMALAMIIFLLVLTGDSEWGVAPYVTIGMACALGAGPILITINIDLGARQPGLITGLWDVMFALGGIIAPYLTGVVVTAFGTFNAAFILLSVVAASVIVVVFIGQFSLRRPS